MSQPLFIRILSLMRRTLAGHGRRGHATTTGGMTMFRRMTLSNTTGIGLAIFLCVSAMAVPSVLYGSASPGDALVIDFSAGTGFDGALFTVNPVTGSRTILSDFGNASQGPTGQDPVGVTVDTSGTILVTDGSAGTGFVGALFTVNPVTGSRTILSDFGNAIQGPTGLAPLGVTVEITGAILVADTGRSFSSGRLFTVSPVTGSRTILSDFNNAIQGPLGQDPIGVVIFTAGTAADTSPPDTQITSAVDGRNKPLDNGSKTGSTSIQFTFTGTDNVAVASFECSLDNAAFSACSSPISYTNLRGGAHNFEVRAVDTSGNVDPTPATFNWFVSGKRVK